MIRLEISGETAQEFGSQLGAVAQLMAGAAASSPASTASATTGRGKKSTTTATSSEDAGSSTGQSSVADSGAEEPATEAGPIDRQSVANKCTQYGSPQKGGPAALKQLFSEFGSANGKWSEVTDDQLPALNARLDELLA